MQPTDEAPTRRPFRRITSRYVVVPRNDIDTDQIIPARFLTGTTRDGLGDHLFADWRYDERGEPRPDFVLNRREARGAMVLVAGDNFGCGSSREHAPWALLDFGFRAVVSSSIADIFRSNSLKSGLLPVEVPTPFHRRMIEAGRHGPGVANVTVDLEAAQVILQDGASTSFDIDPFDRRCLLEGIDELDYLRERREAIEAFEELRSEPGFVAGTPATSPGDRTGGS